MSYSTDPRIKQKIILKRDWYTSNPFRFAETEKEYQEQVVYFKIGTVFIEYDKTLPDPEDSTDSINNEGPYGWQWLDGNTPYIAHPWSDILRSWRSFRDMFEDYHNV